MGEAVGDDDGTGTVDGSFVGVGASANAVVENTGARVGEGDGGSVGAVSVGCSVGYSVGTIVVIKAGSDVGDSIVGDGIPVDLQHQQLPQPG